MNKGRKWLLAVIGVEVILVALCVVIAVLRNPKEENDDLKETLLTAATEEKDLFSENEVKTEAEENDLFSENEVKTEAEENDLFSESEKKTEAEENDNSETFLSTEEIKNTVNNIEEENKSIPEVSKENDTAAEPEEKKASEEEIDDRTYYRFIVTTTVENLRLHEEPNLESAAWVGLPPGTEGYVIQEGEEWTLVTSDGNTGYLKNGYFNLIEIPKEEYPEELRTYE